jgi:hypothetical protein
MKKRSVFSKAKKLAEENVDAVFDNWVEQGKAQRDNISGRLIDSLRKKDM